MNTNDLAYIGYNELQTRSGSVADTDEAIVIQSNVPKKGTTALALKTYFQTGVVSDSTLATTLADYSKLVDEVVIGATDTTLLAADSGKIFISGGNGTFTLPEPADGLNFRVVAGGDHTLNVTPASIADTIMYLSLDAGDKITSTGTVADSVELVGDGENNKWYVVNMKGNWTDGS